MGPLPVRHTCLTGYHTPPYHTVFFHSSTAAAFPPYGFLRYYRRDVKTCVKRHPVLYLGLISVLPASARWFRFPLLIRRFARLPPAGFTAMAFPLLHAPAGFVDIPLTNAVRHTAAFTILPLPYCRPAPLPFRTADIPCLRFHRLRILLTFWFNTGF